MLLTVPKKPIGDKGNDKRLVVYVSQEMYDKLELAAQKEDRSVSNYTRNLLAVLLQSEGSNND